MNYYAHPRVRARMAEFLAIDQPGGDATSAGFLIGNAHHTDYRKLQRMNELPLCLENEFEVSRSLWDSMLLLVDLDIEYVNFDFPAEPYVWSPSVAPK
jgi:hypothetical protein